MGILQYFQSKPCMSCRHMQHHRPQSNWSELSRELWSSIFATINPDVQNWSTISYWGQDEYKDTMQQFQALPRVCKLFRSIFDEQHHLRSGMLLPDNLEGRHLSDLYRWAQQHGKFLKYLVVLSGSPYLEAALSAL